MGGPEDAPQRGVGDLLDLPEQVKDLLAVPDEVAGGQPRRQEHVLQGLALRPLEDGGDEPEVELPAQLDLMRILAPAHGHPELGERLPSPPKGLGGEIDPPGHPFPGFVDQRGDQRGHLGRGQAAEHSGLEGLGDQDVALAVDPSEPLALLRQ